MTPLSVVIATWFGSGYIGPKKQPIGGFAGSVAAMPLCIPLLAYGSPGLYVVVTAILFFLGWRSIEWAEIWIGPQLNHKKIVVDHDQNQIVIDEVIGILVTFLPFLILRWEFVLTDWKGWVGIVIGFGLFRLFDAKKPLGVQYFDNLHTPYGVMMDDVVAGIYAAIPVATWLALIRWILAAPS